MLGAMEPKLNLEISLIDACLEFTSFEMLDVAGRNEEA